MTPKMTPKMNGASLFGFKPYAESARVGLSSVGTPTGQELYAIGGFLAGAFAAALLIPLGFKSRHPLTGGALGLGSAYLLCQATLIATRSWK